MKATGLIIIIISSSSDSALLNLGRLCPLLQLVSYSVWSPLLPLLAFLCPFGSSIFILAALGMAWLLAIPGAPPVGDHQHEAHSKLLASPTKAPWSAPASRKHLTEQLPKWKIDNPQVATAHELLCQIATAHRHLCERQSNYPVSNAALTSGKRCFAVNVVKRCGLPNFSWWESLNTKVRCLNLFK